MPRLEPCGLIMRLMGDIGKSTPIPWLKLDLIKINVVNKNRFDSTQSLNWVIPAASIDLHTSRWLGKFNPIV